MHDFLSTLPLSILSLILGLGRLTKPLCCLNKNEAHTQYFSLEISHIVLSSDHEEQRQRKHQPDRVSESYSSTYSLFLISQLPLEGEKPIQLKRKSSLPADWKKTNPWQKSNFKSWSEKKMKISVLDKNALLIGSGTRLKDCTLGVGLCKQKEMCT